MGQKRQRCKKRGTHAGQYVSRCTDMQSCNDALAGCDEARRPSVTARQRNTFNGIHAGLLYLGNKLKQPSYFQVQG